MYENKKGRTEEVEILKIKRKSPTTQLDHIVVEEPLEIRLGIWREGTLFQKAISVTMRTPGHDEDLALGFLFTEGVLDSIADVKKISRPAVRHKMAKGNVLTVELADGVEVDFKKLERHFYSTSSCGVCGKTSIEAVGVQCHFDLPEGMPQIKAEMLHNLPKTLRAHQSVFGETGGLHAAALFGAGGQLHAAFEDIGRHNALDKLLGAAFRQNELPLSQKLVVVSGRIGFELVQKTVMAGLPILAAVGAPSSLAVSLAEEAGMTLIGFLRGQQFNIYTHPERISH